MGTRFAPVCGGISVTGHCGVALGEELEVGYVRDRLDGARAPEATAGSQRNVSVPLAVQGAESVFT